jgi:hypothetical protein
MSENCVANLYLIILICLSVARYSCSVVSNSNLVFLTLSNATGQHECPANANEQMY